MNCITVEMITQPHSFLIDIKFVTIILYSIYNKLVTPLYSYASLEMHINTL